MSRDVKVIGPEMTIREAYDDDTVEHAAKLMSEPDPALTGGGS